MQSDPFHKPENQDPNEIIDLLFKEARQPCKDVAEEGLLKIRLPKFLLRRLR